MDDACVPAARTPGRIGGEYAMPARLFRRFRGVARGASHASAAVRR
jgi:hypothetical protein